MPWARPATRSSPSTRRRSPTTARPSEPPCRRPSTATRRSGRGGIRSWAESIDRASRRRPVGPVRCVGRARVAVPGSLGGATRAPRGQRLGRIVMEARAESRCTLATTAGQVRFEGRAPITRRSATTGCCEGPSARRPASRARHHQGGPEADGFTVLRADPRLAGGRDPCPRRRRYTAAPIVPWLRPRAVGPARLASGSESPEAIVLKPLR